MKIETRSPGLWKDDTKRKAESFSRQQQGLLELKLPRIRLNAKH
jgi:hypothetical protein